MAVDHKSQVKSRARVRWARPEDYAAVLAIHDFVYDGADYLPVMYHVYLHRKQADCFVLELDGEIVGYKVNHETPDGRGLVSIAVRISKRHQRQGLNSIMIKECWRLSLEQRPWIEAVLYASVMTLAVKRFLDTGSDDWTKVKMTFPYIYYHISRELVLSTIPKMTKWMDPTVVSSVCKKTDFLEAILKQGFMSNVVKTPYLLVNENWFPYKASERDLHALVAYNHLFIARRYPAQKSSPAGLGALAIYKSAVGVFVRVNIWCTLNEAYKSLLVAMLEHVAKVTRPGTTLAVVVSTLGLAADDVVDYLTRHLGPPLWPVEKWEDRTGFLHEDHVHHPVSKL